MITYPLNKIEYNATDAELFHCTRNSGIYASDDFVCTVTGADNNVTIGTGIGWIRNSKFSGKVIANKSDVVLDLGLADASFNRWDIVAIQFDKNNNATDLVVKHGTPTSTPVRPEIVQTETLYELYLAAFYRKAGATTITANDVYDLRLDPTVCGLMADSVTEIDTTGINAQINALIEELREEIAGVESSAEIMLKSVYDTDNDGVVDNAGNGLFEYVQSLSVLTGKGINGKFKATATGTYTAFTIDGVSYAVKAGSETEIELTSGVWYSFILDTSLKTINFKAGGGVSNSKLAETTATAEDVLSGKTFYSGNKAVKTGTITKKGAATYGARTSAQTIAAGQYLSGAQTIAAVTQSGLSAANIVAGKTVAVASNGSNLWSVTGTGFTPSLYISTTATSATTSTVTLPAGTYRLVYTSSCRSDGNPFSCIFDVYVNGSVKLTGSAEGGHTSYYSARHGTATLKLTEASSVYIKAYCTVGGNGSGYYPHACCALFRES